MSCNEHEFCRINVDFKEFKFGLSPSRPSAGVAIASSNLFYKVKDIVIGFLALECVVFHE